MIRRAKELPVIRGPRYTALVRLLAEAGWRPRVVDVCPGGYRLFDLQKAAPLKRPAPNRRNICSNQMELLEGFS